MGKKRLPWGRLIRRQGVKMWSWHYYDADKKTNQCRSTRTDNLTEATKIARSWAIEFLARKQETRNLSRRKVTLGTATYKYLVSSQGRLSADWHRTLTYYADRYLYTFFGTTPYIEAINSPQISAFGKWLNKKNKLRPKTVNDVLSLLSQIFKHAAAAGWIEKIPFIQRLPVQQTVHGRELDDREIAQLLNAARNISPDALRFVALGVFCGLRHSESCRLRWEHIDFERGLINLTEQKTRKADPAPLGAAREILMETVASERSGPVVGYRDRKIGWNRRGVKEFRATWKRIRTEAGIDPTIRYHDLRHTFVTRMFRLLGYEARHLSRHSSTDAFLRYLHADREALLSRAAEAFETNVVTFDRQTQRR